MKVTEKLLKEMIKEELARTIQQEQSTSDTGEDQLTIDSWKRTERELQADLKNASDKIDQNSDATTLITAVELYNKILQSITDHTRKLPLEEGLAESILAEKSFGSDRSTRSSMSKDLAQRGRDAVQQKGVDDRGRGIIARIEKNLTKLADLPEIDITSGNMFAVLKRLNGIIEKEIEKAEQDKPDEK